MHNLAFGYTHLDDFLRPKQGGAVVNPHIVAPAFEPKPDYDKLRLLLRDSKMHPKEENLSEPK